MTDGNWQMALYFDDQSSSFAHGFTCGRIWGQMGLGEPWIEETVMGENLPMIRRMADYHFYHLDVEDLGSGWAAVQLAKTPDDPVKRRLMVIEGGMTTDIEGGNSGV
jgi:hypothetical protein